MRRAGATPIPATRADAPAQLCRHCSSVRNYQRIEAIEARTTGRRTWGAESPWQPATAARQPGTSQLFSKHERQVVPETPRDRAPQPNQVRVEPNRAPLHQLFFDEAGGAGRRTQLVEALDTELVGQGAGSPQIPRGPGARGVVMDDQASPIDESSTAFREHTVVIQVPKHRVAAHDDVERAVTKWQSVGVG